jgi:hypothetical protein
MNSLPYGLNLTIQDHTATRQYYDLVQRVGQQTILR